MLNPRISSLLFSEDLILVHHPYDLIIRRSQHAKIDKDGRYAVILIIEDTKTRILIVSSRSDRGF